MPIFEEFAIASNMHVLADLHLPGEEAISFQVNSKVGQRLTDLFQSVIDYRDNLDYTDVGIDNDRRSDVRKQLVSIYCQDVMRPEFQKIISEELHFEVKNVVLNTAPSMINGLFAVDISFGDIISTSEIIETSTGTRNMTPASDSAKVAEMRTMIDNFDINTGTLKSSTFGKNNRKISVTMFFDSNLAFLAHDFFPRDIADRDNLTARELTAVMLHECGHVMTIVEHCADLIVVRNRLENFAANLKNIENYDEMVSCACDVGIPMAKKLASFKCKDNPVMSKLVSSLGSKFENAFTTLKKSAKNIKVSDTNIDDGEDYFNIRAMSSLILNALMFTITFALNTLITGFAAIPVLINIGSLLTYIRYRSSLDDKRVSDMNTNYNNTFLLERWADEFAVRQGYGADLASGLSKIVDAIYYGTAGGATYSSWLRNLTIFNLFARFAALIFKYVNSGVILILPGYEDVPARITRMLQDQYAVFKNTNLPKKYVEQNLAVIKSIKSSAEDQKMLYDRTPLKYVRSILFNFLSIPNWYEMLINGRLDHDYQLLQNNLDDMTKNSLFASAYELALHK